jgi:RNA polymerase-binding transcription factor DksA
MFTLEQIQSFKQQLQAEQSKIQQELSSIGAVKINDPNNFDSFIPNIGLSDEDNALEVSEYLNKLSIEELLESRLKEITQALHKIETNTFGICEECHKEIELKKLEVNPASDLCISCAKKN